MIKDLGLYSLLNKNDIDKKKLMKESILGQHKFKSNVSLVMGSARIVAFPSLNKFGFLVSKALFGTA